MPGMSGSLMENWPSDVRGEQRRKLNAKRTKHKKVSLVVSPTVQVRGWIWCRACGCVHERKSQDKTCSKSVWMKLWRMEAR